ncbi:MAG: hypothetical protein WCX69_00325 [Candidatus Paceibacterota bacterium]
MTLNDFLLKFFLIVALIIATVFGITYFKDRQPDTNKPPATVDFPQEQPSTGQGSKDGMAPTPDSQEEMIMDVPNPGSIAENATTTKNGLYLPEVYTLPHTESGQVKKIAADNSTITININGKDQRATITSATEIFKDAKQSLLSDINESDSATIIGRKKTADGEEFIADSIYISAPLNTAYPAATPAK